MRCTETNKVWKHFHENPLTHSEAHYLMTVHALGLARATDLVNALNVAAPTVSQALKTLVKKEWLVQNKDKSFSLTPNALEVTKQIEKNKALFMDFFVSVLGIDKTQADEDSCKIEHLISPETARALEQFLHNHRQKNTESQGGLPVIG